MVLENLIKDKNYEITVIAYNSQGYGPSSRPVKVYVGEAVPTGAPHKLEAKAISPTEVRISWLPPSTDKQNGDLLGYKIFYNPVGSHQVEVCLHYILICQYPYFHWMQKHFPIVPMGL